MPRVDEDVATDRGLAISGAKVSVSDIVVNPNEALIDSIDTGLADLVGARTREAIYDQLARDIALAKEDIPAHLEEFRDVLKVAFGPTTPQVESFVARRLYETLGWKFLDMKGYGLNEHFAFVKAIFERAKNMNFR